MSRHLSFANVASATALAVALAGGGYAVAGQHLPRNSVGSPQIKSGAVKSQDLKNGAVKSKDLKDGSVTGEDVNEGTLGEVPMAGSVRTVTTARVTAALGQSQVLASRSGMVLTLHCLNSGGGVVDAELSLSTSVPDVVVSVSDAVNHHWDLDPGDTPLIIVEAEYSSLTMADGSFTALTGSGASWQGTGFVIQQHHGGTGCLAEMTFLG
jgi:hypothetical protein